MEAAFRLLRGLGLGCVLTGAALLIFAYLESRTTTETGPRWAWYDGREYPSTGSRDPIDRLATKVLNENGPAWPPTRTFALAGVACFGAGGLLLGFASQRGCAG